jgi:hypothetical protein
LARGGRNETGLDHSTSENSADPLRQLDGARDRLDRAVELMQQSLDLRQQLAWGVLDIDHARAEVHTFKSAVAAYQRGAS